MFEVRQATIDDAEAACAVLRRSIRECCVEDHGGSEVIIAAWLRNKTVEEVRSWFASRGYAVVAEADGAMVGTALLGANGTLALCYLVPEARYRGIGKAMLEALETESRRRGQRSIELFSTKSGHAFYRRNGYVDTGNTDTPFGLFAREMRKELIPENFRD